MKPVFLCSPFSAPTPEGVQQHIKYAADCMADCLRRGEAPFVPHLLYTQVLDDKKQDERDLGMLAGTAMLDKIQYLVAYVDFGKSRGMDKEIQYAYDSGYLIEFRRLP